MKNMRKYCAVPSCEHNSQKNPNKIFIRFPGRQDLKELWYNAINTSKRLKGVHVFICEDHFNLEKDAENWIYYKLMGRKIILKKDVVPHIFPAKKEESSSQFSDAEKELKRQLLEEYRIGKLKSILNTKTTENHSIKSQYFATSSDNEESSNDSNDSKLLWQLPEKHQPLLLRRRNKIKQTPEIVWINSPFEEISQEDEVDKTVKNAGSIENEQLEAKFLKIKSEFDVEIKQEEIHIVDVHDTTENYLYLQSNQNMSEHITLDTSIPFNPEMSMTMKEEPFEEPIDETGVFEFVNVNTKIENSFFFEDPLKISERCIYVGKPIEESILS